MIRCEQEIGRERYLLLMGREERANEDRPL